MTGRNPKFINRELSWLEFNQRVLDEAINADVPLLERLNFLGITASNLDEFFMVRVGGLQLLVESRLTRPDDAGLTPSEQLECIAARVRKMVQDQYSCFQDMLEPELAREGIAALAPGTVDEHQHRHLEQFFMDEIFPVVTPMAVESPDPFPMLRNLGLHIAVRLKPGDDAQKPRVAVIPIGPAVRRFVPVPAVRGYAFARVEDVIDMFIYNFFPGESIVESVPFRITRNADLSVREDLAADLLAAMQSVLDKRRHSGCVRLEIRENVSRTLLAFLQKGLRINDLNTFEVPGPIGLAAFKQFLGIEGFQNLKYEPWPPQVPPNVDPKRSIFEEIARRDILLFHPYESFEPVVRLIEEAARDPQVLAIKQTLYRTSTNSPVIAALRQAAERGKSVTVIVELKARFDEAQNIEWARELEQTGVQVIYGVKGLKTHSKICVVVRREPQGVVRYLHFGTGNYNEKTARIYSDVSLMTRDPDLGLDASAFFNAVSGYSEPQKFLKIAVAPMGLRDTLVELIRNEMERKRQGQEAMIMAKMNSLVDPEIIGTLYKASQAGVKIRLNVRGICCLRPGVKDLSENIAVVSVVDRFLEHARIFCFHEGGENKVYISSADWMPRNMDRRVELMVPVEDPACKRRLISILETSFKDTAKGRRLLPDGAYERVPSAGKARDFRSQEALYRQVCDAVKAAQQARRTELEPYRPSGSKP